MVTLIKAIKCGVKDFKEISISIKALPKKATNKTK